MQARFIHEAGDICGYYFSFEFLHGLFGSVCGGKNIGLKTERAQACTGKRARCGVLHFYFFILL